jgi:hypothetical protein
MFKPQQGISTYLIPSYLRSTGRDASFVSIEKDKTHVEAATRMIDEVDPTLNDHIEFMQGHSLEMLPRAIEQLPSIDFALLDGGAHPEVCLQEFEMVLGRLSDSGLIMVDDSQEMEPSEAYPVPRPFGKATLILPFLAISEYLRVRNRYLSRSGSVAPDSSILKNLEADALVQAFDGKQYVIVSAGNHRITLVGRSAVLAEFRERITSLVGDKLHVTSLSKE